MEMSTLRLDKNLIDCRKLVFTMKPFLNSINYRTISVLEGTKVGYGVMKRHKENMPIRPIISSIGSLTCGIEEYLLSVLKPLESECEYSINSTKIFKEKFSMSRHKFNLTQHEIASFDAVQLYTSVNVEKVVDYIITTIFKNPELYFKEGTKIFKDKDNKNDKGTEEQIPYPTEDIFRKILINTLIEFNCFSTLKWLLSPKKWFGNGI